MNGFFLFLFGLAVGSFANVLADRLPRGESVLWGRSHCDYCKKTLRWFELIPVLSYVIQRGRCLRCRKRLSIQYPVVELLCGAGFVGLMHQSFFLYPVFVSLLVIFIADVKYQIIPDSMIVLGAIAAVCYLFFEHQPLASHIISAALCFAFFYCVWAITRGRGMGFGDVKFAFFLGLFLGFPSTVLACYVAFLTGAVAGVILMIAGAKTWKSTIAFGPFLVAAVVIVWAFQPQFFALWRMYL